MVGLHVQERVRRHRTLRNTVDHDIQNVVAGVRSDREALIGAIIDRDGPGRRDRPACASGGHNRVGDSADREDRVAHIAATVGGGVVRRDLH